MDSITLEANGKTVVVDISEFKSKQYLGARFMYTTPDGEMKHTKNGISIQINGEEGIEAAQAVVDGMQAAIDEVRNGR